jgi:hypothetical protein
MSTNQQSRPHNPHLLRNELFAACKTWLALSIATKCLVFGVGVISVWFSFYPDKVPFAVGFLMAVAELMMWKSDRLKGIAESLHRKLDFENSFGWPITNAEISDILARTSGDLDHLTEDKETGSNFFASKQDPGPLRAACNLQESSWWSKHLAESMWIVCLVVMLALVCSSVVMLIVSLHIVTNVAVLNQVGRIVTSLLLLIFSLGIFRFTLGYYSFARSAERTEEAAKGLTTRSTLENVDVLKLWQDYQLARASAPIVPTWIWKKREKKLNKLWLTYRA